MMNNEVPFVGQAFQPAGAGDFPVARAAPGSHSRSMTLRVPVRSPRRFMVIPHRPLRVPRFSDVLFWRARKVRTKPDKRGQNRTKSDIQAGWATHWNADFRSALQSALVSRRNSNRGAAHRRWLAALPDTISRTLEPV